MISNTDIIILLTELQKQGVNVTKYLQGVATGTLPTIEAIAFINKQRQLDLTAFYEHIRKSYNKKHSNLYKNIVIEELKDPKDALTTLSALLTQILLFSKKVDNKQMFLRHARCSEISKVLANYFVTYDLTNCLKLLKLIKTDLKAVEMIRKGE